MLGMISAARVARRRRAVVGIMRVQPIRDGMPRLDLSSAVQNVDCHGL